MLVDMLTSKLVFTFAHKIDYLVLIHIKFNCNFDGKNQREGRLQKYLFNGIWNFILS